MPTMCVPKAMPYDAYLKAKAKIRAELIGKGLMEGSLKFGEVMSRKMRKARYYR